MLDPSRIIASSNLVIYPFFKSKTVHDLSTLRFFYNLGHEFFKNLQSKYGLGPILSMIDNEPTYSDEGERLAANFQPLAIESPEKDSPNSNSKVRHLINNMSLALPQNQHQQHPLHPL